MKKLVLGVVAALAAMANAAMWEGLTDENHVVGPKITERDLLGKAVLVYYASGHGGFDNLGRAEQLWKSFDHKRFAVVGCLVGDKETAVTEIPKHKITFPIYQNLKLSTDGGEKRPMGSALVVNQYGRILVGGGMNRDHEKVLVEAITEVGLPPNIIPGVELVKYKSMKNQLKLGANLEKTVKVLEKDVAAAEKKTATKQQKDKASEASSILSAIRDGKTDIQESIKALSDANPGESYNLLSLYVKSFPSEAADYKEKLADLKTKAAEAKKLAK